jgi:hypothetical protein
MTCTREEKEAYEGFQRNRGDKVILVRMSCGEKMSLTNDQRSRSHIKGKVFKNVKMSPKKRAVLENVYRPMKMNFGEKSWCRDQEKKEEFRRPIQITSVKILPVTPVKTDERILFGTPDTAIHSQSVFQSCASYTLWTDPNYNPHIFHIYIL